MIWLLAFEKKPFWFWRKIWIQVVVILLCTDYSYTDVHRSRLETDCIWFFFTAAIYQRSWKPSCLVLAILSNYMIQSILSFQITWSEAQKRTEFRDYLNIFVFLRFRDFDTYRCTSIQTWNWLYLIFLQLPSTREVGNQAAWSLSSCKPGFGVEQIRDDNYETYWQSDGQLPHLVNIQFKRKTTVSAVAIYTDFRWDPFFLICNCIIDFNCVEKKD